MTNPLITSKTCTPPRSLRKVASTSSSAALIAGTGSGSCHKNGKPRIQSKTGSTIQYVDSSAGHGSGSYHQMWNTTIDNAASPRSPSTNANRDWDGPSTCVELLAVSGSCVVSPGLDGVTLCEPVISSRAAKILHGRARFPPTLEVGRHIESAAWRVARPGVMKRPSFCRKIVLRLMVKRGGGKSGYHGFRRLQV